MSNLSNNYGRGYEFACLFTLYNEISKYRKCSIDKNSSYNAAKNAWDSLEHDQQANYVISAASIVETLFDLEPLIIENSEDVLELKIQPDSQGQVGDVRDIIIIRNGINWEIGLSIKHNHFAVKHSRLSKSLDFSDKWFGAPCSNSYWSNVSNIFEYLEDMKSQNKKWSELPSKDQEVYVPLLNAFIDEINYQNQKHPETPRKMVEYLLGEFDFYKVISIDNIRTTQIQTFNLHGTLNRSSKNNNPNIKIPIVDLPNRIVHLEFKPNSTNTVELYMNNGWQFSFRIHNASTYVEPSLKFDIQIMGMPATIISINCVWR